MSIDDWTGIEEEAQQSSLDFIRYNLEKIPSSMQESEMIDEVIENISLRDVYNYISFLEEKQNLPFKELKISYATIGGSDLERLTLLYDFLALEQVQFPNSQEQRIYFIESKDFATTLIPVEIGFHKLNIFMQPLESSPDFITEMWAELEKKQKHTDLALKKYWELKSYRRPKK